jgi:hypothetical protein
MRFETSLYKQISVDKILSAEHTFNGLTSGVALQFRACDKE